MIWKPNGIFGGLPQAGAHSLAIYPRLTQGLLKAYSRLTCETSFGPHSQRKLLYHLTATLFRSHQLPKQDLTISASPTNQISPPLRKMDYLLV